MGADTPLWVAHAQIGYTRIGVGCPPTDSRLALGGECRGKWDDVHAGIKRGEYPFSMAQSLERLDNCIRQSAEASKATGAQELAVVAGLVSYWGSSQRQRIQRIIASVYHREASN